MNQPQATVLDTPESIRAGRILTLRAALRLEVVGFKRHGRSAYAIIKQEFGFKGSKQSVLDQLNAYIKQHILS